MISSLTHGLEKSTPKIETVEISKIKFDERTQTSRKNGVDESVAQAYAELMRDGVEFDPVDLFYDDAQDCYWIGGGWHRLRAHQVLGWSMVKANVHIGTMQDAVDFSYTDNVKQKKPLSNEDKGFLIHNVLRNPVWVKRSNQWIGNAIGVDRKTVSNHRQQLESAGEIPQVHELEGRDGKSYPAQINTDPTRVGISHPEPVATPNPKPKAINTASQDDYPDEWDEEVIDYSNTPEQDAQEKLEENEFLARQIKALTRKSKLSDGELMALIKKGREEVQEIIKGFNDLYKRVIKLPFEEWGKHFGTGSLMFNAATQTYYQMDIENFIKELKNRMPGGICPECKGVGCMVCHGGGYNSFRDMKTREKHAATSERNAASKQAWLTKNNKAS